VKRVHYRAKVLDGDYGPAEERLPVPDTDPEANLVSSELQEMPGFHAPALDLDLPARLVPSSTPGHFHLYVDVPLTWRKYRRLLRALVRAGLVERGYYNISKLRRATFLRTKPDKHTEDVPGCTCEYEGCAPCGAQVGR